MTDVKENVNGARVAIIKAHPRTGLIPRLSTIRRYMPANYEAIDTVIDGELAMLILGVDDAGWTLDQYVIPRLASGLYFADEVFGEEAEQLRARAIVALAGEEEQLRAEAEEVGS